MQVAVIGAGAAGLVCARELLRVGLTPTVFEAGDRIGGTWVYDERSEQHGAMYASLRTNLPRDLMAFRDYPFEAERRFPGHADVLAYLERFCDAFDVGLFLALGQPVHELVRHGKRFVLEVDAPRHFDAVAICTGHYHRPSTLRLPGLDGFAGQVTHSHDYRRPNPYEGRRVALLGAKSSGIDISAELVDVAQTVWLCARDPAAAAPREGVSLRPAIVAADGVDLVLADGSRLERVDDLLLCTGYDYAFPFLDPDSGIATIEPKWVHPLWLDMLSVEAPNVAFIGLPFQVVPFPLMEAQARLFAHLLAGRVACPARSQMLADHEAATAQLRAAGVPPRHFFKYGAKQFDYVDDLAQRVGSPSLPAWFEPLYEATSAARRADPVGYRDSSVTPGPPGANMGRSHD